MAGVTGVVEFEQRHPSILSPKSQKGRNKKPTAARGLGSYSLVCLFAMSPTFCPILFSSTRREKWCDWCINFGGLS